MYSGKIAVPPGGGGIVYQQILKKTIFMVEMCQNVPEEIRIREKNFVRKAGRIKKASRRYPKMSFWFFWI
jgi:hypothetical protein